jgi:hypothetical protein
MTEAERFFYDHGGWPGGAAKLAAAERFAQRNGWQFTWAVDEYDDCNFAERIERFRGPAWYCVLRGAEGRTVLASLTCIELPSKTYKRIVEAELALEAMP